MRTALLVSLMLAGCSQAVDTSPQAQAAPPATETARPQEKLPPDLRTRKTGSDWEQFLGPTADSKSTEKGIIAPWPKTGLKLVWHKELGNGYGMPSISRGRLFQLHRVEDEVHLDCLKSETGELLWTFKYKTDYSDMYGYSNGPRCQPLVDGSRVYIYGAGGMLHCVEAETGKLVWKLDTVGKYGVVQNFFGVGSTPVIEGNLLIAQVGGSPKGSGTSPSMDQKGNGTGIVAFDKYTGEQKYAITKELASYSTPKLATINDRRWCFVFARGGLVGFEPNSGKVDFQYPWRARILESVNASTPVVVDDRVFISETYGPGSSLLKVRPGACDVVWSDEDKGRDKSMQTHWNTSIHIDGYLYGSSGRHTQNAELRCIELATGKVMWSEPGLSRCSLLYIDNHFVVLGEYGELMLLNVNPKKFDVVSRWWLRKPNGREIEGFGVEPMLSYPAWAAPIVSHGLMYLRGEGVLACVELIPADKPGAASGN